MSASPHISAAGRGRIHRFLAVAAPVARIAAGGALVLSGYLKAVRPPEEFAASLEAYWLLPVSLLVPLARVIPWVELMTGLALAAGYGSRAAAGAAGGLYALFIFVLGQSLARGLKIADCGCFGRLGPHLEPAEAIALDGFLLVLCLIVLFDVQKRWTLDRWTDQT